MPDLRDDLQEQQHDHDCEGSDQWLLCSGPVEANKATRLGLRLVLQFCWPVPGLHSNASGFSCAEFISARSGRCWAFSVFDDGMLPQATMLPCHSTVLRCSSMQVRSHGGHLRSGRKERANLAASWMSRILCVSCSNQEVPERRVDRRSRLALSLHVFGLIPAALGSEACYRHVQPSTAESHVTYMYRSSKFKNIQHEFYYEFKLIPNTS